MSDRATLDDLVRSIVRDELRAVLRAELRAEVLRPRAAEVLAAASACAECTALRASIGGPPEIAATIRDTIHCARHGVELAIARGGQ